jgi:serine/threonine protein kinase
MTEHVVTRYYRAPEIITAIQIYDSKIDIWSSSCILIEMLEAKELFPGKDTVDLFCKITELLGSPTQEWLEPSCNLDISIETLCGESLLIKG